MKISLPSWLSAIRTELSSSARAFELAQRDPVAQANGQLAVQFIIKEVVVEADIESVVERGQGGKVSFWILTAEGSAKTAKKSVNKVTFKFEVEAPPMGNDPSLLRVGGARGQESQGRQSKRRRGTAKGGTGAPTG